MKKSRKQKKRDLPPQYYGHALIIEGRWAGRTCYVDDYPTDKSALVYFLPLPSSLSFYRDRSRAVQIRVSAFKPMGVNEFQAYEYEYGQ